MNNQFNIRVGYVKDEQSLNKVIQETKDKLANYKGSKELGLKTKILLDTQSLNKEVISYGKVVRKIMEGDKPIKIKVPVEIVTKYTQGADKKLYKSVEKFEIDDAKKRISTKPIKPETVTQITSNYEQQEKVLMGINKQLDNAIRKEDERKQKTAELIGKYNERSQQQKKTTDRAQELAQSKAINNNLDKEYQLKQKIQKTTEQTVINQEKAKSDLIQKINTLQSDANIKGSISGVPLGAADAERLKAMEALKKSIVDFKVKGDDASKSFLSNTKLQYEALKRLGSESIKLEGIELKRQTLLRQLTGVSTKNPQLLQNEQLRASYEKLYATIQKSTTVQGLKQASVDIGKFKDNVRDTIGTTNAFGESIKNSIKSMLQYSLGIGIIYGVVSKLKEMTQFSIQFSDQMNQIRMITGMTATEANKMGEAFGKTADDLSTTSMQVAVASDEFLRQGRTVKETNDLIVTSQVLTKVGFLESADAAEKLTAAVNAYNIEAKDSMMIVDKMSALDVEAATSTSELARALTYTAKTAQLAGLSLDQILSYITTISETSRAAPETIGQAMKTLLSRIQQVKIGKLVDAETGEDLSNVDKVLKQYNISLRTAQGQFKDVSTILSELNVKWKEFDSIQKSEVISFVYKVIYI